MRIRIGLFFVETDLIKVVCDGVIENILISVEHTDPLGREEVEWWLKTLKQSVRTQAYGQN